MQRVGRVSFRSLPKEPNVDENVERTLLPNRRGDVGKEIFLRGGDDRFRSKTRRFANFRDYCENRSRRRIRGVHKDIFSSINVLFRKQNAGLVASVLVGSLEIFLLR